MMSAPIDLFFFFSKYFVLSYLKKNVLVFVNDLAHEGKAILKFFRYHTIVRLIYIARLMSFYRDSLQIDTLCMAFYARSEEARQSHSIHKLALVISSLAILLPLTASRSGNQF